MNLSVSPYTSNVSFMKYQKPKGSKEKIATVSEVLKPFETQKDATIPPLKLMKGVNPNAGDVFETFKKIDDVSRKINFVRNPEEWITCMAEEVEEFSIARDEYYAEPTLSNREHMEEEMGDIFYTAASIAKDSGIDPQDAFKSANRKFYNRINLMERFCLSSKSQPNDLKSCSDEERRALWNAAKYKLYGAQAKRYVFQA